MGQDFCPSPEAPKTSCRTSGGRSKRPKTKRLSNSKRETLKERTNTLTASYEANTSEGSSLSLLVLWGEMFLGVYVGGRPGFTPTPRLGPLFCSELVL